MKITFCGGAGKVTGSNFLIETENAKVLVDCGIEQGGDFSERDAYAPFPYDPKTIDTLLITHAHLDHVGRIPRLVREGFRGSIYMTPPTADLARLILEDSVAILGEDARRHKLPPLYEEPDVTETFRLVKTIPYHERTPVAKGLTAYFRNTGHILGSASITLTDEAGVAVAFTGDIGNSPSPLLPDWESVPDVDALIMESVYGNRLHPPQNERVNVLQKTISAALSRGGTVLIPSFSIERTQLMLYELAHFFEQKMLPPVPVYLDSPLAIHVTDVYEKYGEEYFKETTEDEMKRTKSLFEFPFLTKTLSHRESEEILTKTPGQKIILAGAGMSHGGRIGAWERKYLPDPKTTLIIVGYQAPGSPGRRMLEGNARVKLGGEEVTIRGKVVNLEGWSGHTDRDGLLKFAEESLAGKRIKKIFVGLGEPAAERFLAQRIHDFLDGNAVAVEIGEKWQVNKITVSKLS